MRGRPCHRLYRVHEGVVREWASLGVRLRFPDVGLGRPDRRSEGWTYRRLAPFVVAATMSGRGTPENPGPYSHLKRVFSAKALLFVCLKIISRASLISCGVGK